MTSPAADALREPLREPLPAAFRRIAVSNLLAQLCEQLALAAAPLAAILVLGVGAVETGVLQVLQTLPFLLLSLPAGLLVDRASRRRLMLGSESLRAVSLALTGLLLASGHLGFGALGVLGFLGAVGTVCYSVAAPAFVPAVVPRSRLADANRWLELGRSLAFAAGPALGGAAVGWVGASAAYATATALSLAAVLLLAGLPDPARAPRAPRSLLAELGEGAAFVAGHPLLRPILLTATTFNASWFVLQGIYVAYAVQSLGLTPAGVGLTLGLYGAGMVAGALAAPLLARHVSFGGVVAVGPAAALLGAFLMLLTLHVPSGALAGASFVLFGAGPILWTITTTTLRQIVTPDAMLGRVSAFVMTATFGARPLGAGLSALVAARYGTGACLVVATAGFLLQFLVILGSPVPRLRDLPRAAA